MSLFDRDISVSSSHASSSDSEAEATLPVRAPPVRAMYDASGGPPSPSAAPGNHRAPLTLLEQRRRMAEADAAAGRRYGAGQAPWRSGVLYRPPAAAVAKPATGGGGSGISAPVEVTSTAGDASKFGGSIAAAMTLRKEEKEKALLKRLQQQRKAEAGGGDGPALAQKDLEVGVFVTTSYRAVLQRSIHPRDNDAPKLDNEGRQSNTKKDGGSDDDDDDPLSTYLRQLESRRQASNPVHMEVAAGDYYDRVMRVPLHDEKSRDDIAKGKAEADATGAEVTKLSWGPCPDDAPVAPPTLSELQSLIDDPVIPEASLAANASSSTQAGSLLSTQQAAALTPTSMDEARPDAEDAEREARSAVLAHARLVYDSREARRLRTATEATVQVCARRCDDRIASSLFCS
jgi:hypothetical protein